MRRQEKLEIIGIEQDTKNFYKKVSEKYGGNWDGQFFSMDNEQGKAKVTLFKYPNNVIVSLADIQMHVPLEIINESAEEERIVAIRIGFHGDINGHSQDFVNSEGISIYDANYPYIMVLPKGKHIRWMAIRVPLSLLISWIPEDRRNDKLFAKLTTEDEWFFYHRLSPEIESLVRGAFLYMNHRKLAQPIFYSRAYEILAHLVLLIEEEKFEDHNLNLHPEDFALINKVKEGLVSDFSVLPNIKVLSAQYNMSSSKLQRSFKAVFGMPIMKFFNQHRLEEAHRLLKYSSKSILEISEDLAFHSASHLSRTFKQQFGYNPNTLR